MRIFVIAATACAVLLAGASLIVWLTLRTAADQLEAIEAEQVELAVAFAELDAAFSPEPFGAERLAKFLTVRKAVGETYHARKPEDKDPEPLNPRLRLDMLKTLESELTFAKMGLGEYLAISKWLRATVLAGGEPLRTLADRYKAFGEPPPRGPKPDEKDLALVESSSAAIKESMGGEWALVLLADLEGK